MQSYWLKREGNEMLIVLVLGWAADHNVVSHIVPQGYDVVCLYDYRNFTPVVVSVPVFPSNLTSAEEVIVQINSAEYKKRYLFAWSFGVWVSERLFGDGRVIFDRLIALNGTPLPVNDLYGIEPRRMAVTIRGLRAGGSDAFNRRAYGSAYEWLRDVLSVRTAEDDIEELTTLQDSSLLPYTPSLGWDKAVIGSGDEIFIPENMLRYWGSRGETVPLPHYPFADVRIIEDNLGD